MNKALVKSKLAEINEAWHGLQLNVMEKSWTIGKALIAIKAELPEGEKWQDWCEANLHLSYGHVSRFLAIGALPKKPELPTFAANAKQLPDLSIEKLALAAGRVKKGISQDLAISEMLFPPAPKLPKFAHDDEPTVKQVTVVVPEVKTKKDAKKYMTRPLALDVIGIVSDKEEVDVFVNRTSLEILFDGLMEKHKDDKARMKALVAAKLVLL